MHDPYAYLQEQECASPSGSVMETSYASSDDGGGSPWAGLSSIAKHVAQTINNSAKSLMNELAELECEARRSNGEFDDSDTGSELGPDGVDGDAAVGVTTKGEHSNKKTILPLPWEICFQQTDEHLNISIVQREDEPLKEKIFGLSKDESIFTGPFNENNSNEDDESMFKLNGSRVILIRRLLEIDSYLGHIHAKVSGRSTVKERIFWQNYFYWCEKLRENREKEINDQSLKHALRDEELDAELVGRPPASCTGFYPRTGKLSSQETATMNSAAVAEILDDRVIPSLPSMECSDGFVLVHESDGIDEKNV